MKKRKFLFWIIVFLFVFIFSFLLKNNFSDKISIYQINKVGIGEKIIKVETALTPEDQAKGLSNRKELEKDSGMLFIFEKPAINYFWMKDMLFSLDIIWINEDLEIIFFEKNLKPESYPNFFGPTTPFKYVLEVEAGFIDKFNLEIGQKVKFLP